MNLFASPSFDQILAMEIAHREGRATDAEFDALWKALPGHKIDAYQEYRAEVMVA